MTRRGVGWRVNVWRERMSRMRLFTIYCKLLLFTHSVHAVRTLVYLINILKTSKKCLISKQLEKCFDIPFLVIILFIRCILIGLGKICELPSRQWTSLQLLLSFDSCQGGVPPIDAIIVIQLVL